VARVKAVTVRRGEFLRNGVTVLRDVLDGVGRRHASEAYQWSLDNPGPYARPVLEGRAGAFYQDHAHPAARDAYRPLLCETGLVQLVAEVIGSSSLWFMYEQVWLKEREDGECLRTPWHQDLPYVPMAGEQLATAWINLDPVARERSLEFVARSHRGPLYNPTAFDPDDASASMYAPGIWPALPDIESDRARWPIVSWAVSPGGVVVFHPAVLHGGAPTRAGERRRTISLRFFGDDAHCTPRPEAGMHPADSLTHDHGNGDPMVVLSRLPAGTPCHRAPFEKLL